jgi:glycosyltransferase involved in cell wall biosynthesis
MISTDKGFCSSAGTSRTWEDGCLDANLDDASQKLNWPPEVKEPTIAIVICTRRRAVALRGCLVAIAKMRRAPDEIIIVDNTSGDDETAAVAIELEAGYLIEPIAGLSRARNLGMGAAKSDIVAYIDDDALPHEDWLDALCRPFADPIVGVVTGGILSSPTASAHMGKGPILRLSNKDPQWLEIAAFGGLGIGTNMALRKSLCGGWKVFDERLGRGAPLEGMEEHRAFVGFLSRGYSAAHVPEAIVIHSSQYSLDAMQDARNSMAYWMLLYSENPGQRRELLSFLFHRFRRKPLAWQREAPAVGRVFSAGKLSLIKAGIAGVLLYMRCRKKNA